MIRRFLIWSFCLAGVVSLPATAAAQAVPVGIAWDANDDDPEGYTVFIGTQPGVYTEVIDVGKNTFYMYSDGVPGQRYYFTVAAYKPKPHLGPQAPEISHVLETFAVAALEAPVVDGSTVTLRWQSQSSTPIVDYLLEAGTSTGMRNIFSRSVGTTTQLSATVGAGTYFVRVVPRTTTHTGYAANEVTFSIGGGGGGCSSGPPAAPTGVTGSVQSGVASISWAPVPGATTYGVQAGSGPGLSDIFEGVVGPGTSISAAVGPGFAAYVRILAVSPCGVSPPSAEVAIR